MQVSRATSLKDAWPVLRDEDGVDAPELGVDLEAEVGQHLRGRPIA